jgi:hypothetical protein
MYVLKGVVWFRFSENCNSQCVSNSRVLVEEVALSNKPF